MQDNQNGLRIAKGGRLICTDWNPDTHQWEEADVSDGILIYLDFFCDIEEGATLRDVISLVDKQRDQLRPLLDKCSMDEYLDEARRPYLKLATTETQDILERIILQVDGHANWIPEKACYDLYDSYDLHAIGSLVDDQNQIIVLNNQEMDNIKISLGFSPISKFLNLPFSIAPVYEVTCTNAQENFYQQLVSDKPLVKAFYQLLNRLGLCPKPKVLLKGTKSITLGTIINVIFDEFSFFGSPSQRDEEFAEVNKMLEEAQREGHSTTITFDELFEKPLE